MTRISRRPPRLRTIDDAGHERHSSALELFFDLVFVVAVAQLGDTLSRDLSTVGFLHFAVLLVPVWWAWVGYTIYADRFDTDDIVFRLTMLGAMLAVAWLAIEIPHAFDGAHGGARFAVAYAVVRFVLVGLYCRADYHEPRARPLTRRYIIGFSAGATLWLVSALLPPPARYALWSIAIGVELAPPLLSSAVFVHVPIHVSHIPERFSAFTIIALGETVVLVATGMSSSNLKVGGTVAAVTGFISAASIWWLYFDFSRASPIGHGLLALQAFVYGHLFVVGGITAVGVGSLSAIRSGRIPLSGDARWALCGGAASFLIAISAVQLASVRRARDPRVWTRLIAVSLLAVLLAAGSVISAYGLTIGVAGTLISAVLVEELFAVPEQEAPVEPPPASSEALR